MRKTTEDITRNDIYSYTNQLRTAIVFMKSLCPDVAKVYLKDPYGKLVKLVNDQKKSEKQMMEEYEDYIIMLEDEAERIGQIQDNLEVE